MQRGNAAAILGTLAQENSQHDDDLTSLYSLFYLCVMPFNSHDIWFFLKSFTMICIEYEYVLSMNI